MGIVDGKCKQMNMQIVVHVKGKHLNRWRVCLLGQWSLLPPHHGDEYEIPKEEFIANGGDLLRRVENCERVPSVRHPF